MVQNFKNFVNLSVKSSYIIEFSRISRYRRKGTVSLCVFGEKCWWSWAGGPVWAYPPGWPGLLLLLSWLSSHVPTVLFFLSCHGCPAIDALSWCSVLSRLSYYDCPVTIVLSQLSCHECPIPTFLYWLSCSAGLSPLSCPGSPVRTALSNQLC